MKIRKDYENWTPLHELVFSRFYGLGVGLITASVFAAICYMVDLSISQIIGLLFLSGLSLTFFAFSGKWEPMTEWFEKGESKDHGFEFPTPVPVNPPDPIPLCMSCGLPSVDKCGSDCEAWFCLSCLERHDCEDYVLNTESEDQE